MEVASRWQRHSNTKSFESNRDVAIEITKPAEATAFDKMNSVSASLSVPTASAPRIMPPLQTRFQLLAVEAAQEENAVLSMELDWLHSAQEDTLQVQC